MRGRLRKRNLKHAKLLWMQESSDTVFEEVWKDTAKILVR